MQNNIHTWMTFKNYTVYVDDRGSPFRLTISYNYNEPLEYLIFQYLDCVEMILYGNRTIYLLPRQLEKLIVMEICNLFTLPKTLITITTQKSRSRSVNILLPKKLRVINSYDEGINVYIIFPKYLHTVTISSMSTKTTLPKSLKHASFEGTFNVQIDLPKNLKHLHVGTVFDKIIELPKGFKHLIVGYSFSQCIVLPKYMKRLTAGYRFNKNIVLSESIVDVEFIGDNKLPFIDNLFNGLHILKIPYCGGTYAHPYSYFENNLPSRVKICQMIFV